MGPEADVPVTRETEHFASRVSAMSLEKNHHVMLSYWLIGV